MINIVSLVDELKDFVEEVVKNYSLELKDGTGKAPQVLTGYLPPKDPGRKEDPDFPFVIVRLGNGQDTQNGATATVNLIIGTYSKDSTQGWKDVASIIERIRLELFRKGVIGKRYRVEYPMKFDMPEEQPYPYWIGIMTTTWAIAHPVEEVSVLYE